MGTRGGTGCETFKQGVVASRGVVASNHPLASAAGVEMLAQGGNAFDAAVASLFALTVVEPLMVSVFGAGFFVFRDGETGRIGTLDNYAVAPRVAREDMYRMVEERRPGQYLFETVGRRNMVGYLSVATPGTLKAWEHVVGEHGALSLAEAMAPAIRLSRDGYRASPFLAHWVKEGQADLTLFPETAKTFLPGGKPLEPGQRVVMPDDAESLELIARTGSDALYHGDLGRAIVDDIQGNGGILAMGDLEDYRLIHREPVRGTYRGYEVCSMAPGSSGGTHIIQILNLLEGCDLGSMGFGSAEHLHLFTEALKIAFADRQEYMGDPERVRVPVEGLTSKGYAEARRGEISMDRAGSYSPGEPKVYEGKGGDTTHVSAVDSDGNMVAATQTLFSGFGSRATTAGTGVLLNNCMGLFDPRPGRANSVAGGKRMLSSMAPTLVLWEGAPFLCIGTPGGTRIFPAVCQGIINIIDFGMSIQQAVEAPRVWTMGIPGTGGEMIHIEPGFGEEAIEGLRATRSSRCRG